MMKRLLSLMAVSALGACSATLGPDTLTVTLATTSPTFPVEGPFNVTATVTNHSIARIQWGEGSSGCQLEFEVRVDGTFYPIAQRVCVADFGPHALEPGASRTESIHWEGDYLVGGAGPAVVAPGTYELRARAGQAAFSQPVLVTVTAP